MYLPETGSGPTRDLVRADHDVYVGCQLTRFDRGELEAGALHRAGERGAVALLDGRAAGHHGAVGPDAQRVLGVDGADARGVALVVGRGECVHHLLIVGADTLLAGQVGRHGHADGKDDPEDESSSWQSLRSERLPLVGSGSESYRCGRARSRRIAAPAARFQVMPELAGETVESPMLRRDLLRTAGVLAAAPVFGLEAHAQSSAGAVDDLADGACGAGAVGRTPRAGRGTGARAPRGRVAEAGDAGRGRPRPARGHAPRSRRPHAGGHRAVARVCRPTPRPRVASGRDCSPLAA